MNIENILHFLIDLKINNNRDWFKENKSRYDTARNNFLDFVNLLIINTKLLDSSVDVIDAKECVFRIYRDVRFSHNKQPYKTNFGAVISRGGRKSAYAGYYVHIEPDNSFLGGGIYSPDKNILKAVRTEIYEDVDTYKTIVNNKQFKQFYPEFIGEKLKTAPKGFAKDFADIDLLKPKHFAVAHRVDNKFWTKEDVVAKTIDSFQVLYPFNQYLNKVVELIEN